MQNKEIRSNIKPILNVFNTPEIAFKSKNYVEKKTQLELVKKLLELAIDFNRYYKV